MKTYGSPLFDWSPQGRFQIGKKGVKDNVISLCTCGKLLSGKYIELGSCKECLEITGNSTVRGAGK